MRYNIRGFSSVPPGHSDGGEEDPSLWERVQGAKIGK